MFNMKRKVETIKSSVKKYTLVITTNVIAWWLGCDIKTRANNNQNKEHIYYMVDPLSSLPTSFELVAT